MANRTCSFEGCGRPHYTHGWCEKHGRRVRRHGDPSIPRPTAETRFWRKVTRGYAHRFSYELHIGPIPEGLVVDHLCSNPSCVNPAHLEAVTQAENVRRSYERGHR